ncbi:MAG: acyltransferase family protein [Clostridia bacterium]|nr:acyltransferase family protein [Clostridia bacterium]
MKNNRIVYMDVLRIFAVFSMMLLHVAGSLWSKTDVATADWQAFNIYDSFARFCVPVFIMLSGAMFLDNSREFSMKKVLKKNVLRLACAFVFWSLIYSVVMMCVTKNYTFEYWIESFLCGRYHLWFVPAIIGLYLVTPFLRRITADKKLTEYFLLLWLIFCSVFGLLKRIPAVADIANGVSSDFQMYFVTGYTGYFVLGYYLCSKELSPKSRKIIYALGILGFLITAVVTSVWSRSKGTPIKSLYNNFMPNVLLQSVAVMTFFRYEVSRIRWSEKQLKIITKISALSFGMYLFHDLINILFAQIGFTTLTYNAFLSVPCNTLIIFAISLAVTYGISKIPYINRYII